MKKLSDKSYIICSTPRTGSSLLCSLLKSTQLAGNPESYFREQDICKWALELGVVNSLDDVVNTEEYVKAIVKAGSTSNGIFATRIMWGTMQAVTQEFLSSEKEEADLKILTDAFGDTKFIYLQRNNNVAQAVSLWRALQTDVWHQLGDSSQTPPKKKLEYNFEEIHKLVSEAEEHNAGWNNWFSENGVRSYKIIYEDLVEDMENSIKEILNFLEIDFPNDVSVSAPHKKLADEISEDWIERYENDVSFRTSH